MCILCVLKLIWTEKVELILNAFKIISMENNQSKLTSLKSYIEEISLVIKNLVKFIRIEN